NMRIDRPRQAEDYRLNTVALASYRDQIRVLEGSGGGALDLGPLLVLPGVVEELRPTAASPHEDWPAIAGVVSLALDRLEAARSQEGQLMGEELKALGQAIDGHLAGIADRGPTVVQSYQKRL